jgi:hypothetical protein
MQLGGGWSPWAQPPFGGVPGIGTQVGQPYGHTFGIPYGPQYGVSGVPFGGQSVSPFGGQTFSPYSTGIGQSPFYSRQMF